MTAEFDHHAATYAEEVNASVAFAGREVDFYARRKARALLDLVARNLGDPQQVTALDVGCGVGVTDGHLAGRFRELHGVDTAADAVEVATARNPSVAYRSYDGVTLPYPEATFDLVFAICVAHHVDPPDRPAFASEMARVLRPGGLLAVFEHNPLNPLTRAAVSRCSFDEGVELLGRREVSALLRGAGLEPVERRYLVFFPVEGARVERAERILRGVPLGAQHYGVGRRPGAPAPGRPAP